MIKTLFFDLNGTLTEFTRDFWKEIYFPLLKKHSSNLDEDLFLEEKKIVWKSFEKSLKSNERSLTNLATLFLPLLKRMGMKINSHEHNLIVKKSFQAQAKNSILLPDVIETLEYLKKKYDLILISNSHPLTVFELLNKYDLEKYFKAVFTSEQLNYVKPHEKSFTQILEFYDLKKSEVVHIGDRIDTDGLAQTFGINTIIISSSKKEVWKTVTKIKEIKKIL